MRLNSVITKKEHLTVDAEYKHYLLCQRLLILVSVMTTNLVSGHINSIVSKASLGAILKCFVTRDYGLLCKEFCAFVRPVLEFSSVL